MAIQAAAQISTDVTDVPVFGTRGTDAVDVYVAKGETLYDHFTTVMQPEYQALKGEYNALSYNVNNNATEAALSAFSSASSANNIGAWSGLTGAISTPSSVTYGNSSWILNVDLADVTLSEPTSGNTDWTEVSGVTQAELDLKADIDSPTFTGTVSGITADMVDTTLLKDADIGSTVQGYDVDTAKTDVSQSFTAPQRTSISVEDNAIDFTVNNNFTLTATAANLTVGSLVGCTGQSGVMVITAAENITGFGTEFVFKTVPTLDGVETLAYFVESETVIRIGKVA